MKKQLQVWQLVRSSLQENIPVMLIYVLESLGSSPGREGFFMAVNAGGEMHGSIGGGIMEHKFVEMAKEKLKQGGTVSDVYTQFHDKKSVQNQSGMICSGEQTNLLYKLQPDDLAAIISIIDCIENNCLGTLTLTYRGISFNKEVPKTQFRYDRFDEDKEDWIYEEQIGYKNNLYIVGSGHCALALCKLMREMDFKIYLYDNRDTLPTFLENDFAHQKKIVRDYAELKSIIPQGDDVYVVVMTVGYRTDDIVVRSLINREFKFFGLLGSKKKIEKMFADYIEEGINEELLKKIYAPVGLAINSQTPEEIAISIAAQIIGIKNAPPSNR